MSASPVRPTARSASRRTRPRPGDGCGKELDCWFKDSIIHPKPPPPDASRRPPLMTMAALPPACKAVLKAP